MLTRIDDFYAFLSIDPHERTWGTDQAVRAAERANNMTALKDYDALAAIALHIKPRRLFEIGTFLGVTSDFFLSLLPDCHVVSIAFQNSKWNPLGHRFNNSALPRDKIGSAVRRERRARFAQLYGDSHQLDARSLLNDYGAFDLVFIDGDHSSEGVLLDTELAKAILADQGAICWHDANPKERYLPVREFLERTLPSRAIATKDDYVGGVACWSRHIEAMLTRINQ